MTRLCPSCEKEILYKTAQSHSVAVKQNKLCVSCSRKKNISEDLTVTCVCGKITTYSNKYNANAARINKSCSSCSATNANYERWKDPEFRARRGKAVTERWHKYWAIPGNKEKMSKITSERNIERWKDDEYRNFMYEKMKLTSTRGICGNYKGFHFRSSLELKYMIEYLNDVQWRSGESKDFAIRYTFENKTRTYYPDFIIGTRVIEIKPTYLFNEPIVVAKSEAAIKWCESKGFTYEMIDPGYYTVNEVLELHNNGTIILESKKLLEAIKEKVEPKTPPSHPLF